MERHGIGTDASIATHINNICERNYVQIATGQGSWMGLCTRRAVIVWYFCCWREYFCCWRELRTKRERVTRAGSPCSPVFPNIMSCLNLKSPTQAGITAKQRINSLTAKAASTVSPRTRSPSSRHPLFTHYPFPPRSLVCGGQPSPHKPRLVVSHRTCQGLHYPPPPTHTDL